MSFKKLDICTHSSLSHFPLKDEPTFFDIGVLPFRGESVIYFQAVCNDNNYGMVPGFKASDIKRTGDRVSVTVRLIPGLQQRKIAQLLRHRLKGPINFW